MSHLAFSDLFPFMRRHPAFARVFAADVLSQLGNGMMLVAFPMFFLEVTKDVSLTGLAFSGEIAAYSLLAPVAGYWADRVEQKALMVAANVGRVTLLLSLLYLLSHGGGLFGCVLLSIALGGFSALFLPARAAFLRRLLRGDDLLLAVALEGTMGFLLRMIAPALMGLILVAWPATVGIWLNIAIYAVSTVMILPAWVTGPRVEHALAPEHDDWRAGWRHILRSPALRGLLGLDVVLSLVGMAAWSTTIAFLQVALKLPAAYNGWLVATTGLAGAVGTRLAGVLSPRRSTYAGLLAMVTITYLAVPQAPSLGALMAIWALRGLVIGAFVVLFNQQIARETPADRMGRVQAAWEMSACLAAFLGSVATPLLLRGVGPAGSFYLFGVATLSVTLLLMGSRRR